MPKLKLTDLAIQQIRSPKQGQIDYFDLNRPSFGVRVSSKGTKSFFVMARPEGKLRRITLGRYPLLTLKDARGQAGDISGQIASGEYSSSRKIEQIKGDLYFKRNAFESVAEEFMDKYARNRLRPKTIREYERTLLGPSTKHLAKRPLSEIKKSDIRTILDDILAQDRRASADRTLAYLRKFFNWAADRDYIQYPPTDRIRPTFSPTKRDRALSTEEIIWVWKAFEVETRRETAGGASVFGPFLKLLLLTGQRRDEVARMEWRELKKLGKVSALWELPQAPPPPADQRTKNGLPHLVPLSPLAVEILGSVPRISDKYVFSTNGKTPISGFSKLKQRIDLTISDLRRGAGLPPIEPWTLHDLRRTFSTQLNGTLHVETKVVEACLNHLSGEAKKGVAGVYNRALYLPERRDAMDRWSAYLLELGSGDANRISDLF